MTVIDYAISYICHTTKYTPYQCYRVVELLQKYGEKTKYHCSKKQKDILDKLFFLFSPPKE